jgi:hypothetical protein
MRLLREESGLEDHTSLGNCEILEANGANDQEVGRGIAVDDQLKRPEPSVSLTGFAAHPTGLF